MSNDKMAATFDGEDLAKPGWLLLGKGSDDRYCSTFPTEGHHYVSRSVVAPPVRWIEICSFCGHISSSALRAELARGDSSTVAAAAPSEVSSGGGMEDRQPDRPREGRLVTLQEFD